MKHKTAKLGTLMLGVALALFWLRQWWPSFGAFCVVGIIDLVLIIKYKKTISCWVWKRFRGTVDAILMTSIVVATYFILGKEIALGVLVGVIAGHLGWQRSEEEDD